MENIEFCGKRGAFDEKAHSRSDAVFSGMTNGERTTRWKRKNQRYRLDF